MSARPAVAQAPRRRRALVKARASTVARAHQEHIAALSTDRDAVLGRAADACVRLRNTVDGGGLSRAAWRALRVSTRLAEALAEACACAEEIDALWEDDDG